MGRLFGTDGVRGLANADLTPELALAVAVAAARVLAEVDRTHPPLAVVGRDPRASGEMLEAAVVAGPDQRRRQRRPGRRAADARRWRTWSARPSADLGVMLSASHNPMPDNGIKLFAAGGHKLPDEIEDRIEAAIDAGHGRLEPADRRPASAGCTTCSTAPSTTSSTWSARRRTGSTGSRSWSTAPTARPSDVAPTAYREAGAEVIAIHAEPDGLNINDGCGSTHLDARARRRRSSTAPTWASPTTATPTAASR